MTDDIAAELLREVRRIRELLERRQVPRDERHVALVQAIAAAAGTAAFTSAELLAHAQVEGALRDAINAACGMNGRKLGRALRRIEGLDQGGLVVERIGEDSSGVIWCAKPVKRRLVIA